MRTQAANLFERTVKGLTRALGRTEGNNGAMFSPAAGPKALAAAERALLALIASLDAWAGPLKVPPLPAARSCSQDLETHGDKPPSII